MYKNAFFFLLFAMLLAPACAQTQSPKVSYLGTNNGLSNNSVYSIFQDHNGFMWFGTYDGLNRYDGYDITVFRNIIGDSTSLPTNAATRVGEDEMGNLWVGGQKDISIYNPATMRFAVPSYKLADNSITHSINSHISNVQRVGHHTMLVGTFEHGLFYFEKSTTLGKQVPLEDDNKREVNYLVKYIAWDSVRDIAYVVLEGKGLYIYDAVTHRLFLKSRQPMWASCLSVSRNGDLWIGNGDGVYRMNMLNGDITYVNTGKKMATVNLCESDDGYLWIASDGNGVMRVPPGSWQAYPLPARSENNQLLLRSNAIYSIYQDKQKRMWLGTLRGGVSILEQQPDKFQKIIYRGETQNESVANFVFCFAATSPDKIWIGTDGDGIRLWNRRNNSFTRFVHDEKIPGTISSNFVTDMIPDGANGLWVSSWFGGIDHFDATTKLCKHYDCINTHTNSLANCVWSLLKDSHDRTWAGAVNQGGIFLFNRKTQTFDLFDDRFPELQSLAEDRQGNLWAGDYTRLVQVDTVHKQHKTFFIGYPVRSIYEDKKNNFWLGTQGGGLLLFNRKTGKTKQYTTSSGLPHNTILNILEDRDGNLWLSTFNGLTRFKPSANVFENFTQADGLQSAEFSFHGALALENGEMLFGGNDGFNIFVPEKIAINNTSPPLFLSGITINSNQVQERPSYVKDAGNSSIQQVEVPYDQASLSLSFLGLDYSDAPNLNYAYYLQGWDKSWSYVKKARTANYSRLHEGSYIFKVMVSRKNGKWSEPTTLLYLKVLPPWYRSWWAYLLYTLLGIGAIQLYLVYKNRQTRLQYEIKLAQLEKQQEKELNEKKIAFFTNVSHEFRAPLSLIINPIKDLLQRSDNQAGKAQLKIIQRNAQRLLRMVDHLLLFKKAEAEDSVILVKLDIISVLQDAFDCFTEQARLSNISYEFKHCSPPIFMEADREKIEIVFFNILSNAFKHTPPGGTILVTAEEKNGRATITISDTGSGIAPEEGEKLFHRFYQAKKRSTQQGFGIGLYLVKTFVDAHRGTVSYTSEPGKGTSFIIGLDTVSASDVKEHFEADEITNKKNFIEHQAAYQTNTIQQSLDANATRLPGMVTEIIPDENTEEIDQTPQELTSEIQSLLLIDDDVEMLDYLASIFKETYRVYKANSAEDGIRIAHEQLPDIIISDIVMPGASGIELCQMLKQDEKVSHIPLVLLTGTSSDEVQLKATEIGADDYVKKPFDKDLLTARVKTLLKRRNILQNYFYNEVTLGSAKYKVSAEYKEFLQKCMKVIEEHLDDDQFSIKVLTSEMGMSHSNLYRKVKSVSGQSINGFIRFIRLRKAAEILINTENNVNQTASLAGFNDIKYFRTQFSKQFGMMPSDYIKKYRKPFHNTHSIGNQLRKK